MNKPYQRKEVIGDCTLYLGDCMEVMPTLGTVDAVVTDPPYGTTRCAWDAVLPMDKMWEALNFVRTDSTPVALFGSEPFSSMLRLSNLSEFRYDWIWNKVKGTGFLNAKRRPLVGHEIVSVFSKSPPPYYPQKTKGNSRKQAFRGKHLQTDVYGSMAGDYVYDSTERYPRSVLTFSTDTQSSSMHPTQKPVDLLRYLLLTYSRPGELVLDYTMGSGSTGVASVREGRSFIGIELDPDYFEIACKRIREAYAQPDMFVEQPSKQAAKQEAML